MACRRCRDGDRRSTLARSSHVFSLGLLPSAPLPAPAPYRAGKRNHASSTQRLLTLTFPLSSSTPYFPLIGPAQNWVPRTASAA